MHVEIINKSNNPNPEYQTDQSAGMDLRAYLEKTENIAPGEYKLITIVLLVIVTFVIYIFISILTKAFKTTDIKLKY